MALCVKNLLNLGRMYYFNVEQQKMIEPEVVVNVVVVVVVMVDVVVVV